MRRIILPQLTFYTALRWVGALALVLSQSAGATVVSEDIGELKIHDLLLRPSFQLQEPSKGNFSIGESSFALRWELEQKYAGVIRIGPRSLLNPTARYRPTVNDDVTLVEAFAEYSDVYGRFRMGRIPIEFGHEGRLWERQLIFPRSMLYSKRVMMLRDVGVAYDLTQNSWYTGLSVHNGESDNDLDSRMWYTARWGFREEGFEIGMAGQAGSTQPASTKDSADTLAQVDPTINERWRMAGLFAAWTAKEWEWVIEAYMGELEQLGDTRKFAAAHTDYSYMFSKHFSAHLRYDYFDPYLRVDSDKETQISLALMQSNATHSSNIILVGTKDIVQGSSTHSDKIMLIWSLSPRGVVRF